MSKKSLRASFAPSRLRGLRTTRSVRETEAFAAELARSLRPNTVIALHGELGAGKTHFVRGLVAGLGGNPNLVSSPTFVLLNVYDSTRIPVFHLDAYRVSGSEDFETIGFTELLDQNGIVVIEWPEKVAAILPTNRLDISIETTGANRRRVHVSKNP
jgi:tRNA threonylcarbamoyladenosine biosynthesis protein TsaE